MRAPLKIFLGIIFTVCLFSTHSMATIAPLSPQQQSQYCYAGSPYLQSDMCWGQIYGQGPVGLQSQPWPSVYNQTPPYMPAPMDYCNMHPSQLAASTMPAGQCLGDSMNTWPVWGNQNPYHRNPYQRDPFPWNSPISTPGEMRCMAMTPECMGGGIGNRYGQHMRLDYGWGFDQNRRMPTMEHRMYGPASMGGGSVISGGSCPYYMPSCGGF